MNKSILALVIDDDEFVLNGVARQLTHLGVARVATATEGSHARGLLRAAEKYDLIVCDLLLPGVDGVELLRDIAEVQPDAAVIMISGLERKILKSSQELAHARNLNVLGVLEKPITTANLSKLLARLEIPWRPHQKRSVTHPDVSPEQLRAALAAGEIDIHVQPKVDAYTRRIRGVEALARWTTPTGEKIPPDRFIGVAESSGLIDELTDLVFQRSLKACGEWNRLGLETSIAVNVPITSLDRLNLPEKISALVDAHGVHPNQLIVEVTETGLMQDLVRSLDVLTRLRLRGVALSIDDFGTGHSSLKQLKRLPFSELKIDRSFVSLMSEDLEARRIVQASVELAHGLNLSTVAEGVETQMDWDMAGSLGCDLLQGWFIAKALPTQQFLEWAKKQG